MRKTSRRKKKQVSQDHTLTSRPPLPGSEGKRWYFQTWPYVILVAIGYCWMAFQNADTAVSIEGWLASSTARSIYYEWIKPDGVQPRAAPGQFNVFVAHLEADDFGPDNYESLVLRSLADLQTAKM